MDWCKSANSTANEHNYFKYLSKGTQENIYLQQRVFLLKFILTATEESEPVPRLLAYGCQTCSIRAACQHLPQLFDFGNLSNPNLNATSPTFMPFITKATQAPQLCSHKHRDQTTSRAEEPCRAQLLLLHKNLHGFQYLVIGVVNLHGPHCAVRWWCVSGYSYAQIYPYQ